MLKHYLKKSLANLNTEQLKQLIRIKDEIVGSEAGFYGGAGSGLMQYLSNDYLDHPTALQENISVLITEKVRTTNYDKEEIVTRLEDKTHALLKEMPEEAANLTYNDEDLQTLKNIVSKVIKNVDEKYVSLLNKKSEELIGDRHYSYFSGYYYTGLLSIMHEVSYTNPEALEKDIKQIFINQLGATANIFRDDTTPEGKQH
jgi:predicted transcriptional regulator